VRENVAALLDYSNNTKKRNFLETVELQIGLKNYDPQRDKRTSSRPERQTTATPTPTAD
jgi:large subunit ribosomal protein L10Ae